MPTLIHAGKLPVRGISRACRGDGGDLILPRQSVRAVRH